MKDIFQKSIVSIVDIPKDSVITNEMIGFKKPGTGLPSNQLEKVIGRKTKNHIPKDRLISEKDIK